jgi:predicted ATPase
VAGIEVAREYGLSQWLAQATICRGAALIGLGKQAEGMAQLQTGRTAWHRTAARVLDTQWLGLIADAYTRAGQLDDALAALDRAVEISAATGENHHKAELFRLKGLVLAGRGELTEAASSLQQAAELARRQQAKSLELRAATSLARLWADQGKRSQARDLLAPIYGWFTEGFETADLKDAKALLEQLP